MFQYLYISLQRSDALSATRWAAEKFLKKNVDSKNKPLYKLTSRQTAGFQKAVRRRLKQMF